jgi:serine/threonine-protein kinase
VCLTMAYAHARGVIHRDLKPSNIMVGSFGEVQVMDWGLAKVLPEGGVADEARGEAAQETVITTVRSGSAGSGSESQAGSVLGTPAYMAPEQARSEVERIDERADVFGLGAILCEILTGRPPYAGSTREEIRAKAARGDLADALGRLEASGTDRELVILANDCLAAEPAGRPRDASAVAGRITAYLSAVQERLKAAELARVEAQARAEEERKRRRVTVALAASILGLVLVSGGGWAYLSQQRMERVRQVDRAAGGVEHLYAEARGYGDDLSRWAAAREAAHALQSLLANAPDAETRDRLNALVGEVYQAAAAAATDQSLLAQLAEIRAARADDPVGETADANYVDAFRAAGISIDASSPIEAAAKIRARPVTVRIAQAAALDDWSVARRFLHRDQAGARRLVDVARLADPDPWRDRLRAVQFIADAERLAILRDLAQSARSDDLPVESLHLLFGNLMDLNDVTGAEAVLHEALRQHPGDCWLNYLMAKCLERQARLEEAIRYYMAARSIRPEVAHDLAHALERKGETERAIAVFQDLAQLRPRVGRHLSCLGTLLKDRGRTREAREALDRAITVARAAADLRPGSCVVHFALGYTLHMRGDLSEAIAEYRESIRLKPDYAAPQRNLGNALLDQGKVDEAIAAHRNALRLEPDNAEIHTNLSNALKAQGKADEATAELLTALRLRPNLAEAHVNLGLVLFEKGKLDEAIAEYRTALRLRPNLVEAHHNLGRALRAQGKGDEAIAAYRTALRLRPNLVEAHCNLGNALRAQGKGDEAIAAYRTALRLRPNLVEAHYNLGIALRSRGEDTEAIAELRKARDLAENNPRLAHGVQRELTATERQALLTARLASVLAGRLKPADAAESIGFAKLCHAKKLYGASGRFWADAFRDQPKLADDLKLQHRYNAACAAALAGSDQGKDNPPLDEATKARWRKQALDWLQADLAAWSKILASGPPQARQDVAQMLQHWKADPDLAGLRDPAALAKLPEDEQRACHALWAEVDTLLAKARGSTTP